MFKNPWDALRDLVSFVQFKKRENTHGEMLLLVKLQTLAKCKVKIMPLLCDVALPVDAVISLISCSSEFCPRHLKYSFKMLQVRVCHLFTHFYILLDLS